MGLARHRRYRRQIDAYIDGELDHALTRGVVAHLGECWGCSGEVQWRRLIKASTEGIGRHGTSDLAGARLRRWAEGLTP